MSPSRVPKGAERLSELEMSQLGRPKPLQAGGESAYRYVPPELWATVRAHMVARSRAAAARGLPGVELPERMTAYTPGETMHLLREPEVVRWHHEMESFTVPAADALGRPIENIVFVPCAKTKPWDRATTGLYGSYNAIRAQVRAGLLPATYFVTISEPLGVVPEERWGDFPQYDNPGLFKNEVLRAGGLLTRDWADVTPGGEKYIIPFDERSYRQAIDDLGAVVARFIKRLRETHPDARLLSFVENMDRSLSTHGDMLNRAESLGFGIPASNRHAKKAETRIPPAEHLAAVLTGGPAPERRRKGSRRIA